MSIKVFESSSAEETRAIGEELARGACPGEIYAFRAEMGAGKTVFSQGFAKGLGIEGVVSSPTFTILQIYEGGRLPLYHFDVYRIEDPEEMQEVGLDEYLYGDGVCLIEWSELIDELLPANCIKISIIKDKSDDNDHRTIKVEV